MTGKEKGEKWPAAPAPPQINANALGLGLGFGLGLALALVALALALAMFGFISILILSEVRLAIPIVIHHGGMICCAPDCSQWLAAFRIWHENRWQRSARE